MSLRLFRKYQKKMLWPFAILIIVTFGVTSIMSQVLEQAAAPGMAKVFGNSVTHAEFQAVQNGILPFVQVMNQRGSLMDYMGDPENPQEMVWNYIKYMSEVERLGITVSRSERDNALRKWYRDNLVLSEFYRETSQAVEERLGFKPGAEYSQYIMQAVRNRWWEYLAMSESKKEEFARGRVFLDEQGYIQFVQDIGYRKPATFERLFEKKLLIEKLINTVTNTPVVSTDDVFDRYREIFRERKFSLAVFHPDDYREDVVVTNDEVNEYYMLNRGDFRMDESIDYEYVFANEDKFVEKAKNELSPTEEELKEFYNANRMKHWRDKKKEDRAKEIIEELYTFTKRLKAADPVKLSDFEAPSGNFQQILDKAESMRSKVTVAPKKPTALPKFKDYAEVSDDVLEKFYEREATRLAADSMKTARNMIAEEYYELSRKGLGEYALDFDVLSMIADRAGLDAGRKNQVYGEDEFLQDEIGHMPEFQQMFNAREYHFSDLIKTDKGLVIYRVVYRRMEHEPPIDEIQDEITHQVTNVKAAKAALEAAEEARENYEGSIDDTQEEFGFVLAKMDYMPDQIAGGFIRGETFAQGTVEEIQFDPETGKPLTQPYTNEIQTAPVELQEKIFKEAFKIEEPGGLSEPFQNSDGRVFMVHYEAEREPGPGEFKHHRDDLVELVKSEKRDELFKEWKKELDKRANLTYVGEEKENDDLDNKSETKNIE